jgi:hypothetical protein
MKTNIVNLLVSVLASLHLLQPTLAASIQKALPESTYHDVSRRTSDDWMPGKCRDDHYFYDTFEEEIEHRKRHFRDCKEYWINSPTAAPFKLGSPTSTPTRSPTPSKFRIMMYALQHELFCIILCLHYRYQSILRTEPTGSPTKRPTPLPTAKTYSR